MESYIGLIALLIPIVGIIGGFAVVIVSMLGQARLKELRIRERIALIEKGLVPPPERDPAAFASDLLTRRDAVWGRRMSAPAREAYATKCTRAGIILVGIGLMLLVIIGFAGGAGEAGVGVGGGIAVLGCAFLVCGMVERFMVSRAPRPGLPPPESHPMPAGGEGDRGEGSA